MHFSSIKQQLIWQHENQKLIIEPWNDNSLRVRSFLQGAGNANAYSALMPAKQVVGVSIDIAEKTASIRNGKIKAVIALNQEQLPYVALYTLRFYNTETGDELVSEKPAPFWPPARHLRYCGNHSVRIEYTLNSYENEKIFGMGQRTHGRLDQKGCLLELRQVNSEVSIPFVLSSRGYGFLWNNPSVGQVHFGANMTRWVADSAQCLDYWITAGDEPKEIMAAYMEVSGKPPILPEWASGFWQCKLRYKTQDEVLEVAREYRKRGLPLSVIVIDYWHWTNQGDWCFDPNCFPDPKSMVRELEAMGVKLMVSVWPTVDTKSQNYDEMRENGLLLTNVAGLSTHIQSDPPQQYYDPTNPKAREFLWEKIKNNYYSHGIKVWWLDAVEPELFPTYEENTRYYLGGGEQVSSIYPLMHQQGFYEGMTQEGETEIITLNRSAWVGSQRYGAAVWSGDIPCAFESLANQVRAGLNIAVSGIPWWTTDIGGFFVGNIESEYFRELIVRWFQYGTFCPLFRLHGVRCDNTGIDGKENEVWSFGSRAYEIIKKLLFLRERLHPYIMEHMRVANETGIPVMRPLFFEYPSDSQAYEVEDAFLFGPDILVAPILSRSTWNREVYLPKDRSWQHISSGKAYEGGQTIEVAAPLENIPIFVRDGSTVLDAFK
jgi:alpha-D-xyloside xylohydrolase